MKQLARLLMLVGLVASSSAHAQVQSNVPEVWPGKVMIGVRPLGVEVGLGGALPVSYKLGIDVAGIIGQTRQLTFWLGGELNVGGQYQFAAIEPGIFFQMTLEKLLRIPLVPMIRAGISGPIGIPYGYDTATVYGAFELKVGGGAYYFLTKNIGVGADTHFALGPSFVKNTITGDIGAGWGGYWDFMAGARFAL